MPRGDQLTRQWRIWRLLAASGQLLSAAEIASRLDLPASAARSVRRDLAVLKQVGAAIETSGRGRDTRYGTTDDGPPPRFDADMLLALHLALGALEPFKGTPPGEALDQLARDLERRVPRRLVAHFRAVLDDVTVRPAPAQRRGPDGTVLTAIQTALATRRALKIDYAPLDKAPSRREVHPQGLVFTASGLYLHALDATRGGSLRTFRADRIRAATPTSTPLRRDPRYDPDDLLAGSLGAVAREHAPRKYVLRVFRPVIARWFEERPWHSSQTVERARDGTWTVTLMLTSERELLPRVLSMGDEVEVVAPARLRAHIERLALAVVARSRPETSLVLACPEAVRHSPARHRSQSAEGPGDPQRAIVMFAMHRCSGPR